MAWGDFPFCRPRVAQTLLVKHVGIAGPLAEPFGEGLLVEGYIAATLRTNLIAAYTAESGHIVLQAGVGGGFGAVPFEVVAGLVHDDSAHASASLRKSLSVTRPCGSGVGQEVNRAAVFVEERHRVFVDYAASGVVNRDERTLGNRYLAAGERHESVDVAVCEFVDRLGARCDIGLAAGSGGNNVVGLETGDGVVFRIRVADEFPALERNRREVVSLER